MKIQLQQADLSRALNAVANVVSTKTTLPILSTILFDVQKDGMTLAATDLDVSVVTRIREVQADKPGKAAIPAAKFVPFVRTLSPDPLTMEMVAQKVKLRSGKARLEEPSMAVEEFPNLPKIDDKMHFSLPGNVLVDMIRSSLYVISRDETRPALQGVLWELGPNGISMVATDGHRLARIRRKVNLGIKEARQLIASSAGLTQVLRLADGVETVQIYVGEHQLSFEMGDTTVHTKLVEGIFPNYEQVIPKSNQQRVVCDRATLAKRVKRVKISADRVTNQIRFELEANRMTLSAAGTEGSQAEDEIEVEFKGDPVVIGFNHNYVEDVLRHLPGENVTIALDRPDSATIFVPGDSPDINVLESDDLCLLMPLRLND